MPLELVNRYNRPHHRRLIRSMHRDRKSVFVDLLGWDVPVLGDLERDGFDGLDAAYLIAQAPDGDHLASLRLLRTDRPHLLDTLFRDLCEGPPPTGAAIREISRLCVSPRHATRCRADCTALLASALVDHALAEGIAAYTAVSEVSGLARVLAAGWRCTPLGLPRRRGRAMVGAIRIEIEADTIARLQAAGRYRPDTLVMTGASRAIAA